MNERLDLAIEAYHDGTLDAAGAQLLSAALRGEDAAAARERLALTALLGQAFTDDDAIVRSVAERIDAEQSASAVVRAVQQSIGATRRSRPRRRSAITGWWAAAAALLIAVGAGWWLTNQQRTAAVECRLVQATGVSIHRAGTLLAGVADLALIADDHLETTGPATLRWADGSQIALAAGSRVVLIRPGVGQGLRLEVGTLDAEIAPQRVGQPFAIATTVARVEVMGTRFRIAASAGSMTCDLHQGMVRVVRAVDDRGLELVAGESITVAPGRSFAISREREIQLASTSASAPAPLGLTPVEPAWSPLFPATDLAGWQQQHGAWTNADGVIRGSDSQRHGKARLLSLREFADLELTCRLRITGVDLAEVQVGTYNWFVEVPASATGWVELRLSQRGPTLTATADGVVLTPQPGDGKAMRSGSLGFYVMPGGILEITDARIREPLLP